MVPCCWKGIVQTLYFWHCSTKAGQRLNKVWTNSGQSFDLVSCLCPTNHCQGVLFSIIQWDWQDSIKKPFLRTYNTYYILTLGQYFLTEFHPSFPDVQERCAEEIDRAMGNQTPSLEDKPNTPYFEATLLEITRHCPHLALTVQHQAVEEFEVGGYKIPKETQVNMKM